MNAKVIETIVFVIAGLFILLLFNVVYMSRSNNELSNVQIKIEQNHLLSKDVNLKLNNAYRSSYINYDNLNLANKKLLSNIENLLLEYKSYEGLKEIYKIVSEQNEQIDLVKRTNSIIHNSIYFINFLQTKAFMEALFTSTQEIKSLIIVSKKLVDISNEMKFADKLLLEEYGESIEKLKNVNIKYKNLSNFQNSMLIHANVIYENAKIMQKEIKNYNILQNKLNTIYSKIEENIKNKNMQFNKKIDYSQIAIFILLITLIILIYKLLRIEKKYNQNQKNLQDVISKNIITSSTDLKGIITSASEAYCEISGYTQDELIGKPHNIIRHSDMPSSVFKDMWKTIQAGEVWKGEVKNRKKNGDSYWVYAVIEPIFNSKGKIESYHAIRIDITDKKNLNELIEYQEETIQLAVADVNIQKNNLIQALKAKSEFLANMSHEIRTPLNAILGFIEILKEESKNRKSFLKYVEVIDSSGKSLLKIIEDILDFSKIESGKLEVDKINFNTKAEFEVITYLFSPKCSQKNIRLSLVFDENLPQVINTDPLRVKQIIANLLSNAIKFSSEYKNIIVKIGYENGLLNVSVKDEGKGIAEDKLSHIFEAFSQEDGSTTREFGGTGLGLSISSALVGLLGGELKVKSEVGIGSEFYFSIPVTVGEEVVEAKENLKDMTFEGKKVLLVEDNEANKMFMKVLLKKLKLEFDVANDGIEAIIAFKTNKYDLILMDENMPNLNGMEATKYILAVEEGEALKHTPIIALTANALKGDKEKFLEAGMDEYLTKPIDKNALSELLQRFLI